jgi:hypothetical protein
MGPFAHKYGKHAGSEAWIFVYLSAMSLGILVISLVVGLG